MAVSPLDIDDLDMVALKGLVLKLLGKVADLERANAELRAEITRLKGLSGRPDIKPSGMDKKARSRAEAKAGRSANKARRGPKKGRVSIDERRIIKVDAPEGSRFKGFEDYLIQDIHCRPHTVLLRRERWQTPDGGYLVARCRGEHGVSVDDTGARHRNRNGVTTQIGNHAFTWFCTTFSKSRLNFLDLLRAGHADYVLNEAAYCYMRKRNLAGSVMSRIKQGGLTHFADQAAWMHHLDRLGITVQPDPVRIATEGALWGAITEHGLLGNTVILSDDAGQFNVALHALCWVHAERLIHKLDAFSDRHRREKERIQARLWRSRKP